MSRRLNLSIFEYDNYRTFLADAYRQMKADRPGFSFRYFSREAGFTSPNFLKLVIDGKRNLSLPSIEGFAKALKLNKAETGFFRSLVLLNQASTLEERQIHSEQLLKSRALKKLQPLKEAQLRYYTQWYFVAIRELVGMKDFREDPEWIASRLNPPIAPSEAMTALSELEKLGLIARNAEGRFVLTESTVASGDEVMSPWVARFHTEMMRKAQEAIERFPRNEREISAVTVGVSPETATKIKERIREFRREILALANSDQKADRLYQFNFQLFPLDRGNS